MKSIFLLCVALVSLNLSAVSAQTQTSAADRSYADCKDRSLSHPGGSVSRSTYDICMTTQRIDDQNASLNLGVAGELTSVDVLVQPVHITRTADSEKSEAVGEATTLNLASTDTSVNLRPIAETKTTVAADAQANWVKITLVIHRAANRDQTFTHIIPLRESATISTLRIAAPSELESQ